MNPYRITAEVTIVETNEVTKKDYVDVNHMMAELIINIEMAELAFGRRIIPKTPKINGDYMNLSVVFADTGAEYMTVNAQRHIPQ